MTTGAAAINARNAAYAATAQLAATQPSVLAAGGAGSSSPHGSGPAGLLPGLQAAARKACFVDQNPTTCATLSQQLGAQTALSGGVCAAPGSLDALKAQGSVRQWFYPPSSGTVKPISVPSASVALAMAPPRS